MKRTIPVKSWLFITAIAAGIAIFVYSVHEPPIDYSSQVKPILNKHCITCHGGVRRKAGFSLLFRSEALANTESGKPAIIPGDPDHSEMIRRLTLHDPEERMPYRHAPLSSSDIKILRNWIKQGAAWGAHWAYVPVAPVTVPDAKPWMQAAGWTKNKIDFFIADKFHGKELTASPAAANPVLLRRVSLDLSGLPPTIDEITQFTTDTSGHAYEKQVDRLLASKHFGEKWASMWMDLARYADTKGYERDDARNIWRYRDWIIKAFNNNMPYDQFITEQLAGDLLDKPTDEQLVATAFNRNTMTNDEGGTDNEEFRVSAVLDRVNTTWEALMGTTFACVQCHSHPYDPFTHEEYYRFMAFFNNTRDEDSYADYPLLRSFPDSALNEKNKLNDWLRENATQAEASEIDQFLRTWQPAINSLVCDKYVNSELNDTKWVAFRQNGSCRLRTTDVGGKTEMIYRYQAFLPGGILEIMADSINGKLIASIPLSPTKGWEISSTPIIPLPGTHDFYFHYTNPGLKKPDASGAMFDWFYFTHPFPGEGHAGYQAAKKIYWSLATMSTPTTPVMQENPDGMRRVSQVFERGNWLVKGTVVQAAVPHSLNPMPKNAPANRLGLAMWMTSKENPLTARTLVNRFWEQLFGTGLVETLEDLGTQGIPPTHQELLDYLSYQFMYVWNWDMKKLLKEMVMSATYQQDSKLTPSGLQKDQSNKYYARGPRVRLSAEQLRDQALCVTGLLSEKMYGPSVMPFQPEGIWRSPYDGRVWEMSKGEDRYRRAVYTYWKRTAPYPAMVSFDGVAREVCTARRIRTNTPLQALVSLNDEGTLDMARKFAMRLSTAFDRNLQRKISCVYERATCHGIDPQTLQLLTSLYNQALHGYSSNAGEACSMAGTNSDAAEIAALVVVINAVLNLDEVITKN